MPATSTIRTQIEVALAHKIPSALTPAPKMIRPMAETGIESVDNLLQGGLPIGASWSGQSVQVGQTSLFRLWRT